MNETAAPMLHPRRQKACYAGQVENDLAAQTTARLVALNATLAELARAGADPLLQSKQERTDRRKLRGDVYAEIARIVGPADRIELAVPDPHESVGLLMKRQDMSPATRVAFVPNVEQPAAPANP